MPLFQQRPQVVCDRLCFLGIVGTKTLRHEWQEHVGDRLSKQHHAQQAGPPLALGLLQQADKPRIIGHRLLMKPQQVDGRFECGSSTMCR